MKVLVKHANAEVDFPDDMSHEDIVRMINEQFPQETEEETPENEAADEEKEPEDKPFDLSPITEQISTLSEATSAIAEAIKSLPQTNLDVKPLTRAISGITVPKTDIQPIVTAIDGIIFPDMTGIEKALNNVAEVMKPQVPCSWNFTVNRGNHGEIESITADPECG
jgi:hypothetical protein